MNEINQKEFEFSLRLIVKALSTMADEVDPASVQINDDGVCMLRQGVQRAEHLTVDQFARRLAETGVGRYGT